MVPQKNWMVSANTWLCIVVVLYIALWLVCPQEFIASDPWSYSKRAFDLSQGYGIRDSHVFDHRLGVTIPVALIYSILGVDIYTTNLWSLCAALMVIITVWFALPDDKSKFIGTVMCLISVPLVSNSIALFPDLIATACMGLSSLLLFNRRRLIDGQKIWMLTSLGAVFFLFFAFLAKESAYWILPLWIYAFISDLKVKEFNLLLRRFYYPALFSGVVLGASYLILCQIIWGNPLARIEAIQDLTGEHLWSWDKVSTQTLVKRLTIDPINLFNNQFGGLSLIMSLIGFLIAPKSVRPWGYYTICCILFFWFGSTSFTRYEPMPLFDRMTMPALPGLYILAAFSISRLYIYSTQKIIKVFPIFFLFGLFGLPFMDYLISWRYGGLTETKAISILKNEIEHHPDRKYLLVSSDKRSPDSLSFFFGYKYPSNLSVVYAENISEQSLESEQKETYLFINRERSKFLKSAFQIRNFDQEIKLLGLEPVFELGGVLLFKAEGNEQVKKLMESGK